MAPLDVEKEKDNLTRALGPLIARGAVSVTWLVSTTWQTLQDALLGNSWHVVHFIGHGDFDVERDEGVLALETEEGRIHRVAAANFVDLLREAQPMPRLVVLNACESATSSGTDMFSGVAAALVRGGVSAVTAMQFEISDPAAIAFCQGFYAAIGRGRGVDEAVRSGRVAILGLGEGSLEWITPSLYLRGNETHLFALTDAPSSDVEERRAEAEAAAAAAAAAADSGDAATAVLLYDAVLSRDPDDQGARARRERVVAKAHAGHACEVPPAVAPAAPRETVYPDRMNELWSVAKRTSWTSRALQVTSWSSVSRMLGGRGERLRRRAVLALVTCALALAGVVVWQLSRSDDGTTTTHTVLVSSQTLWHNTGIDVEPGDRIRLTASGEIRDDYRRPERLFGPEGGETRGTEDLAPDLWDVAPELPHGALLGRWGSGGEAFLVGRSADLTPRSGTGQGGRLHLTVNDIPPSAQFPSTYEDNEGSFRVRAVLTSRQ